MKFSTQVTLTEEQWNQLMRIMCAWGNAKKLTLGEAISLILQDGINAETEKLKELGI
jgi:hypothetical protein